MRYLLAWRPGALAGEWRNNAGVSSMNIVRALKRHLKKVCYGAGSVVCALALSERVRVRWGSRIIALLLLALAGRFLTQGIQVSGDAGPAGSAGAPPASAINVEIQPQLQPRPAISLRKPTPIAAAEPLGTGENSDNPLLLWVDGPSGEMIFRDADQYLRCLDARARRVEEPDCPSQDNRSVMVFRAS